MRIFVSQEALDAWYSAGRVAVEADMVSLPGGARGRLEPAVCFLRLDAGEGPGDGGDPYGLLGRVKTEQQLRGMGTRPYGNSVVLGETAYEVRTGFVIELSLPAAAATATATAASSPASAAAEQTAALRRFLADAARGA